MKKFDSQLLLKCTSKDRETVREISERLCVTESSVARVAFKKGLEIVAERGITLENEAGRVG